MLCLEDVERSDHGRVRGSMSECVVPMHATNSSVAILRSCLSDNLDCVVVQGCCIRSWYHSQQRFRVGVFPLRWSEAFRVSSIWVRKSLSSALQQCSWCETSSLTQEQRVLSQITGASALKKPTSAPVHCHGHGCGMNAASKVTSLDMGAGLPWNLFSACIP